MHSYFVSCHSVLLPHTALCITRYCYSKSSVHNVEVPWPYKLGYFKHDYMHGLRTSETQHRQSSSMVTITKSEWNWSLVAVLSRREISLKCDKIGPRLLLMTNRKSHTRFRLVPKSTTLRGHYALCFKTRASFGAHHENLNEDKLYYQRRRRSPITLDSDNKVYADIRSGFQDLCKFS